MKIIFTSVIFLIVTNTILAQPPEHLSFKGVPIDGTLDVYVSKMIQNGFSITSKDDDIAFLIGDFAGYKNCKIEVSTLKQKDLVSKISVSFPNKETWSTLYENYLELKNMLTEKYGKPTDVIERFNSISEPQDDNSKLFNVEIDNCKYYSIWKTKNGEIKLSINHLNNCFINLSYFDRINNDIIKAKAKDDL